MLDQMVPVGAELGREDGLRTGRTLRAWHFSKDARYDGLCCLKDAGLIHAWQASGRAPFAILTEPGADQPLRLF
jgi:hypothetical protein